MVKDDGSFHQASWDEALDYAAEELIKIRDNLLTIFRNPYHVILAFPPGMA